MHETSPHARFQPVNFYLTYADLEAIITLEYLPDRRGFLRIVSSPQAHFIPIIDIKADSVDLSFAETEPSQHQTTTRNITICLISLYHQLAHEYRLQCTYLFPLAF